MSVDPLKPSDLGLHFAHGSNFATNLKALSTVLKKHEVLIADGETLKVKELKPLGRIAYAFRRKNNEKQVKQIVTSFVSHLNYKGKATIEDIDKELSEIQQEIKKVKQEHKALGKASMDPHEKVVKKMELEEEIAELKNVRAELLEGRELLESEQKNLETLLYDRMGKLSLKLFDRSQLPKSAVYKTEPQLKADKRRKKELKAELDAIPAHMGKARSKKERVLALDQVDRRIAKAKFAQALGVPLKPIGAGMSGSYFATDYKGKIKGVFKPAEEESLTGNSPKIKDKIKRQVIRMLPIANPAAPFHSKEGYLSEALTTTLAKHLRFHTVPAAKVVELSTSKLKDAKGSFQVFVKDTESAKEALLPLGDDEVLDTLSRDQFEELAAIDFLNFNRDRHFDNFLVDKTPNPDGTRDIYLIDHGLSFPKENPSQRDILYRRNQFKWASLPHAQEPFSDEMKEKLIGRLSGNNLKHLIDKFDSTDETNKHFKKVENKTSQEIAFRYRVAVLMKCLEENWPISKLATIKTQEDIERELGL